MDQVGWLFWSFVGAGAGVFIVRLIQHWRDRRMLKRWCELAEATGDARIVEEIRRIARL